MWKLVFQATMKPYNRVFLATRFQVEIVEQLYSDALRWKRRGLRRHLLGMFEYNVEYHRKCAK